MKKIVAINASPRKGWNTDIIVTEAAKVLRVQERILKKETFTKWRSLLAVYHALGVKFQPGRME